MSIDICMPWKFSDISPNCNSYSAVYIQRILMRVHVRLYFTVNAYRAHLVEKYFIHVLL